MFRFILFLVLLVFSCTPASRQERIHRAVTGEWLVLWGEHQLENDQQYQMYGKVQDSIIEAKGLKLLRFFEDGSFVQMDIPERPGKWQVSPGGEVVIGSGGKGFDHLQTSFHAFKKDELELVESVKLKDETIRINWHFKKIKNSSLFDRERNEWRAKPVKPESEREIRSRLSTIFLYYADYFKLVSNEASYFIGRRVPLPLKFYQHAMGTVDFDPKGDFALLFYNEEQAREAHDWVKRTVYRLGNKFPDRENFVEEYAEFMKLVGKEINK
jgi:hypothetical protein